MKNLRKRVTAAVVTLAMTAALLPITAFAEKTTSTVYVTVENSTLSNAAFTGKRLENYPVEVSEGDKIGDAIQKAFDANNIEQEGLENGYITSVNGLFAGSDGDDTTWDGWMVTLNDWITANTMNSYYVSDGDEIALMYSITMGADLGGSYTNNDTKIKSLSIDKGELDKEFSSDVTEYTLTLPEDVQTIRVTPTAVNKNFQTRIYKNANVYTDDEKGYQIEGESAYESILGGLDVWSEPTGLYFYKRTWDIPVTEGDDIIVACGLIGWDTSNKDYSTGAYYQDNGSVYTIHIKNGDVGEDTDAKLYDVSVKVLPADAEVEFYKTAGFDDDGYDIIGEKVEVTSGTDENYHLYTMTLPEGTYSYRAKNAEGSSLGGMTFDVPNAESVDGENASCDIVLREVDLYTATKLDGENYATAEQYKAEVYDADGKQAVGGKSYVDGKGYTKYPYMLFAGGNTELYIHKLIPIGEYANTYGTTTNTAKTVSATGTGILTASYTLPMLIESKITAPVGAKVSVTNQIKNFFNEEVDEYSSADNGDGTVTHIFKLPKNNAKHKYRVSADGKITRAGYLSLKSEEEAVVNISFEEDENPKIRPEYDTSTGNGKYAEDNLLLNINEQNYLRMSVGESFKVRAYRAAWQIVNSVVANIMIEPDFHYEILSGDSVSLEQDGQNAVLKAEKEGVSIVKVTYDAVWVNDFLYGATDPSREGIFVVNVGGSTETEIKLNTDWDSDFDTVYFIGDSGSFTFAPTSSEDITVSLDGKTYEPNENGEYTVDVKEGNNNLIKVSAGDTDEYIVVKANKVTPIVENVTHPGEPIKQGDTVNVSFEGLHMPVPKFSGIYNPLSVKILYNTEDGTSVTGKPTQYDFINNHKIEFTAWKDGELSLSGGRISVSCMGFEFGAHRSLTDTGIGANFNAVSNTREFSVMPDLTINVEKEDVCNNADTSEVKAADNKLTGSIVSEITVNNEDIANTKAAAFLGVYDKDGNMLGVLKREITLKSGENSVRFDELNIDTVGDSLTIKVFVWDNENNNIKPLSLASEKIVTVN